MARVKNALVERGVPDARIRYEIFGPDRELAAA
jgi:ferredoxin-NADP reductase